MENFKNNETVDKTFDVGGFPLIYVWYSDKDNTWHGTTSAQPDVEYMASSNISVESKLRTGTIMALLDSAKDPVITSELLCTAKMVNDQKVSATALDDKTDLEIKEIIDTIGIKDYNSDPDYWIACNEYLSKMLDGMMALLTPLLPTDTTSYFSTMKIHEPIGDYCLDGSVSVPIDQDKDEEYRTVYEDYNLCSGDPRYTQGKLFDMTVRDLALDILYFTDDSNELFDGEYESEFGDYNDFAGNMKRLFQYRVIDEAKIERILSQVEEVCSTLKIQILNMEKFKEYVLG